MSNKQHSNNVSANINISNISVAAVILAGGQGTRFWPLSRKNLPKQFLSLGNAKSSMIKETARRIEPLIATEAVYVVTNEALAEITTEHLPYAKLILEPSAKNTTAAIGLAAALLSKQNPKTVILSLHADHVIQNEASMLEIFSSAINYAANNDVLVTLGIKPEFANTAYGYIEQGKELDSGFYKVNRFYEKPSQKRAEEYLQSGKFFWNSGMFIWRAEVILKAIETFAPDIYSTLMQIAEIWGDSAVENQIKIKELFGSLESIAIDLSVLEHAKNVVMIPAAELAWNDVGSWDAWAEYLPLDAAKNAVSGDVLMINSKNCIVRGSDSKLIAVLGLDNVVVVDHHDSLLICDKAKVQEVKLIVEELKKQNRTDLI